MRVVTMGVVLSVLSCSSIAGPSPSASVPAPVLVKLQSRLRGLLERYHPGVRVEVDAESLVFEHDTRIFLIPEYRKAGEPRKLIEVRGPSPCTESGTAHGILGGIRVVPGKYAGQRAVRPGVFFQGGREEYFETLWGVVPSPNETEYLDINLAYPACTDSVFLKQFREIVQEAWRGVE
jgi:hypothetical protein